MIVASVLALSFSPLLLLLTSDRRMFPENEYRWSVTLGIVFYTLPLICAWICVAGVVAKRCCIRQWHRPFLVFSFGLAMVISSSGIIYRGLSPPSAASYFEAVFGSALPPGAGLVRVRSSTLPDSNVWYSFACPPGTGVRLALELGMKEEVVEDDERDYYLPPTPKDWPDFRQWKNKRNFSRRDGATGRMDFLWCDDSGAQVYVYKDPGASKGDEQLEGTL